MALVQKWTHRGQPTLVQLPLGDRLTWQPLLGSVELLPISKAVLWSTWRLERLRLKRKSYVDTIVSWKSWEKWCNMSEDCWKLPASSTIKNWHRRQNLKFCWSKLLTRSNLKESSTRNMLKWKYIRLSPAWVSVLIWSRHHRQQERWMVAQERLASQEAPSTKTTSLTSMKESVWSNSCCHRSGSYRFCTRRLSQWHRLKCRMPMTSRIWTSN